MVENIVFDTGVGIPCLNVDTFERLNENIKSKLLRCKDKWRLTNANGGLMTVLGELEVDIKLYGPKGLITFEKVKLLVVKDLGSSMLFGTNIMKRFKRYEVNYETGLIGFEPQSHNDMKIQILFDTQLTHQQVPVLCLFFYWSENTRTPCCWQNDSSEMQRRRCNVV